ncbi:MAG: cyanophycinase [Bryobacteraceae bacterium]
MRLLIGLAAVVLSAQDVGPARGSLVMVGGGRVGAQILERFVDLAGGRDAPIVIIPTAGTTEDFPADWVARHFLHRAGCTSLAVLHTRDRRAANSEAFVEPLRKARGVWFDGGRHWRLVDSYLNTRAHREMAAVLERGGVIGGSSAGATIQGSYLVRGAREGNTIMMAPGYEEGLGFLRNTGIDQHLLARKRENDMIAVVEKHPKLLGIGIDESTAIVVTGDNFEVLGTSKVAIYEHGRKYYFLSPGDAFDLRKREARKKSPSEPVPVQPRGE